MGSLPKTRFFSTKLGFFTGPTICWVFEAPGIYMISPFETIAIYCPNLFKRKNSTSIPPDEPDKSLRVLNYGTPPVVEK